MCRASYYRYDVGLVWCSLPTERIKAIHEHHVHLLQSKEVRKGLMKSRVWKMALWISVSVSVSRHC